MGEQCHPKTRHEWLEIDLDINDIKVQKQLHIFQDTQFLCTLINILNIDFDKSHTYKKYFDVFSLRTLLLGPQFLYF